MLTQYIRDLRKDDLRNESPRKSILIRAQATGLLVLGLAFAAPAHGAKLPAKPAKVKSALERQQQEVLAAMPPKPAFVPGVPRGAQPPAAFIAKRAQKIMSDLKSRPLRPVGSTGGRIGVSAEASKAAWLKAIYEKNMIEASWATRMLADKRILAEVLERELGAKATKYYPRTLGLKEFLWKRKLVDSQGRLVPDGNRIEAALYEEFPSGFIVRPAVGVAPQETGRGLYPDTDQFVVEILKEGNRLYSPEQMSQPIKNPVLNAVASGEAIVLQENVVGSSDAKKPLRTRFSHQARVHVYESRVIEGAVPERWVQTDLLGDDQLRRAEAYVDDFLKNLSLLLLNRQAWGIDVAVMDNGEMRITDIVTNRGRSIAWSGYLDQPRVIGAYSRHFEAHYGLKFEGWKGSLIRNNFANYLPYWEKRIEKARPGWSKVIAYLPPLP